MTLLLQQGYQQYAQVLTHYFEEQPQPQHFPDRNRTSRVAPVGDAYLALRGLNKQLWHLLYMRDEIHPTPHGTWLQSCILFATLFPHEPIPNYDPKFWTFHRETNKKDDGEEPSTLLSMGYPTPTEQEAHELRELAWRVVTTGAATAAPMQKG